jgi:hypothetical protein
MGTISCTEISERNYHYSSRTKPKGAVLNYTMTLDSVYVCIYVCMYLLTYIHMYVCTYEKMCEYIYIYVCVCVCACVCINIWMHV